MMNNSETFTTSTVYRQVAEDGERHLYMTDLAQKQPGELPPELAEEWELDPRFANGGYLQTENGGKAVALRHKKDNRVVIAFSPMDLPIKGSFGDLADGNDIEDGGKKQWEAMRQQVHDYQYVLDSETKIEKSGHSLGVGIVQHSLHDDYASDSPFLNRNIKGYGYEGIGAAEHMTNPERLDNGRMTHVLVKNNDWNTMSGKHAGDTIYGIEPANQLPVLGEALSHSNDGVRASLRNLNANRGKSLDESYQPKYEQNTLLGKAAKKLSKQDELLDRFDNTTKPKRESANNSDILRWPGEDDLTYQRRKRAISF